MEKLKDSIEAIVDNVEDEGSIDVVLNFKDSSVDKALKANARLAQLQMFGGADVLQDPQGAEGVTRRRGRSKKSALGAMHRSNVKNIGKLSEALSVSGQEARMSRRTAEQSNLWLASAYSTRLTRETLAGLRNKKALLSSVMEDTVVQAPIAYVSNSTSDIDDGVWGLSYVDAPEAWITGSRGANVNVSVIDTGINAHQALSNVTKSSEARFTRDSNGRVIFDDYVTLRSPTDRGDGMGHGTHVAGTIAGKTTGGNIIGIAPEANLMSASVFDGATTMMSAILRAMQWSVEQGADIINMSLGSFDRSRWLGNYDQAQSQLGWAHDAYNSAISNANRAGCLVVAAIGNDGAGSSKTPGSCLGALSVGAMSQDGRCAGFSGGAVLVYHAGGTYQSNYIKPDLSAPGVHIKSSDRFGQYTTASGTSMATPCVSGVAALVLSASEFLRNLRDPYHRAVMLKYILKYSAVNDLGEFGTDTRYGDGVVSARKAVKLGRDSVELDKIYTRLMNAGLFD